MSVGNIQRDRIDPSIYGAWSSIGSTDHAILLEASSSHYSIASMASTCLHLVSFEVPNFQPLLSMDTLVSITRYVVHQLLLVTVYV
jgi:hypothetical protein